LKRPAVSVNKGDKGM